jgi:hypothetical protein
LGQFVGPGIGAEVESGVAEAGAGLLGQKIDAGKAALREFVPAGEGQAVLCGAKFVEVDHLALSKRYSREAAGLVRGLLRRGGFLSQRFRDVQKL